MYLTYLHSHTRLVVYLVCYLFLFFFRKPNLVVSVFINYQWVQKSRISLVLGATESTIGQPGLSHEPLFRAPLFGL